VNRFETVVRFACPKCLRSVSTTIVVPGPDSEGAIELSCPRCSSLFDGHCITTESSCDVTIDDYGNTTVQAELPMYMSDDLHWEAYDAPDDPRAVFMDSYHHTGELLAQHGGVEGAHLVNRMIFSQQIGAIEAYLADKLINLISDDADAMKRLLSADKELATKKFTLAQMSTETDFVKTQVLAYLRSIIYHNIPKVQALYKIVANVDLYDLLGSDKEKLLKAIEYRHDCVHRNGRDSKGNQLEVFTKAYVQEIADFLKVLVDKIEFTRYHDLDTRSWDDLPI